MEQASISANQSRRGKRQFFRARFYHGAKIRISAVLPPLVNLVGECLPQTLLMCPVGRERRSTLEEKIQHAPPQPCGQNPHCLLYTSEDGGIPNPHFHVLCPIRPIEQNGKWGLKQRRVYELSLIHISNGLSKPFADGKSTGDSRFSGARGCSHLDGTK